MDGERSGTDAGSGADDGTNTAAGSGSGAGTDAGGGNDVTPSSASAADSSVDTGTVAEDVGTAPGTRQRVTRLGSRRARLEPAPGSDPSPEVARRRDAARRTTSSPEDERYLRDLPPHWS
ncbi:hypothetical protein D9V30_10580 [Mycetocola reblochoni]|uniref:Uncharacterized protein n=2 Tax=Mycetocola reblochoni TaxID=331618 RepID=A0A1R4IRL9_9MICO|nr:hypothetical protein D9V30_10580 [Mycetocola reblochoni]SJN21923.1 hypothetical protein FM119_02945 [Mycetocola reblochoni REB411]